MHGGPLQGFLLLTVHLAEAPSPTYTVGSGKKYSKNIQGVSMGKTETRYRYPFTNL